MCRLTKRTLSNATLLLALMPSLGAPVHAALVDLSFDPELQVVDAGDAVFVDLVASSSDGGTQGISAMDVILVWDPAYLQLQGVTNPSGQWLVSGFLPDPDGINDDVSDGQAIYTALAIPLALPTVPPDLVVTQLEFTALLPTTGTVVQMAASAGTFARTRVFGEDVQEDVTGDFSGIATVVIESLPVLCEDTCALCDGDVNCDGEVDPLDAGAVLARFGLEPCDFGVCRYDVNCDGEIDPLDAGYVLARFGICNPVPPCYHECDP